MEHAFVENKMEIKTKDYKTPIHLTNYNDITVPDEVYNTIYFIPIKVPQGAITNIHS